MFYLRGGLQRRHQFSIRELIKHPSLEIRQPFKAATSIDEDLVLKKGRKTSAVKGHAEVLGLRPQLGHDVVVELGHLEQKFGEFWVLKGHLFVLTDKLFADLRLIYSEDMNYGLVRYLKGRK